MIVMGSMDMDRNSYEVLCEIHSDMKKELEKHLAEMAEKRKRIEKNEVELLIEETEQIKQKSNYVK